MQFPVLSACGIYTGSRTLTVTKLCGIVYHRGGSGVIKIGDFINVLSSSESKILKHVRYIFLFYFFILHNSTALI